MAAQAGLDVGEASKLTPKTPAGEAWSVVCRSCRVEPIALARHVSAQSRLNLAETSSAEESALKLVPERIARQFRILPLRIRNNELHVATSDPANLAAEQAIGFASGRRVTFEIASPSEIDAAIQSWYAPDRLAEGLLNRMRGEVADAVRLIQQAEPEAITAREAEKAPVVRLTNLILHDAIRSGASDIHIEPELEGGVVRVRVDGVMQPYMQVPRPVLDRVVSRVKVMGSMDVSDRLRPHSGRARIRVGTVDYDLRISTVPTRQSEKGVLRVLAPGQARSLSDLALPEIEEKRLRQLFGYRDGLVVVSGPTGSGKTTTLYAALHELATGKINIMTVEDPVEYELAGVTQIQVAPRQGLTFASVLRTILRQDPDVILLGEIRDIETADIALQASMTGHIVLTTLHTNDAVGVLSRLSGLGLNKTNIGMALRGAVAQRLVRRICMNCRQKIDGRMTPDEERLAERYGVKPLFRANGCDQCAGAGYKGRIPILEILTNSPALERLIAAGETAHAVSQEAARGGTVPMLQRGLERVSAGETTLDEIDRVLGDPLEQQPAKPAAVDVNILIVGAESITRDTTRKLQQQGAYRVAQAADAAAAMRWIAERHEFALVLVDLETPGFDGREFLIRLKSSPATVGLPVVMLTGEGDAQLEAELIGQGADDFIRKPIESGVLTARVKACFRRIHSYEADAQTKTELTQLLEESAPSVAVLPFADMSPEHDQAYFCEGLAEELINSLSRVDGLRVATRTSAFRFKAATSDAREIGRQLGVSSVLEGSIRKSGGRVRITAHLVNVEDGYELMSAKYERGLEDVFEVQDEISREISEKLKVVLGFRGVGNSWRLLMAEVSSVEQFKLPEPKTATHAAPKSDAYELYLKGRYEWNRRSEEGLKRSVDLFKQALASHPDYALAYAGLADAYVALGIDGALSPNDAMPQAIAAAERAIALDGRSAEALTAMGCARAMYVWDWDAESDFRRAIELDPNSTKAHQWYAANYLMPLARFGEARIEIQRALQLDPQSPAVNASAGMLLYFERHFDRAAEQQLKTIGMDPGFGVAHYFLGLAHIERGRFGDAISVLHLAASLTLNSPEVLTALGCAFALGGDKPQAQEVLDQLIRLSSQRYISPVLLSQVAIGLGDEERALSYLDHAFQIRAAELVWIGVRPVFDSLRSKPRFRELYSQIFLS